MHPLHMRCICVEKPEDGHTYVYMHYVRYIDALMDWCIHTCKFLNFDLLIGCHWFEFL